MNKRKSLKYIACFMGFSFFINDASRLQASYGYHRFHHKPQENFENNNQLHQAVLNNDEQLLLSLLQSAHWRSKVNKMNQDRLTPLHLAIRRGNANMVRALLQAGSNLHQAIQAGNSRYYSDLEYGDTALGLALSQKIPNDQIIEALISYGASIKNPLTIALQRGRESLVRFLLKGAQSLELAFKNSLFHQALNKTLDSYRRDNSKYRPILDLVLQLNPDINSKYTSQEQTALHQAVKAQQIDLVTLFLRKGASIILKDKEGRTPFHVALTIGNADIAHLLIKHGADIQEPQEDGKTTFRLAVNQIVCHESSGPLFLTGYRLNHSNKLSLTFLETLLEKGANINAADHQGVTPLHAALNRRSPDLTLIDFLLDFGADPNAATRTGQTPLSLALDYEAPLSLIKDLINRDAQVNLLHENAIPLLHRAILKQKEDIATFLLRAGAKVNAVSSTGQTALFLAIKQKMPLDFIERLIEEGADINQEDHQGLTPLHQSLISCQEDVAQFLIKKGANVLKAQNDGKTPLHCVLEMSRESNFLEILLNRPQRSKPFSSHQLIRELVEKGADINAQDDDLNTPLHLALQHSNQQSALYLIQRKANITKKNNKGVTPLHLALEKGYFNMARYFIQHGADVDAVQHEGKTPLHCAFKQGFSEDLFKLTKVVSTDEKLTAKTVSYQLSGIVPLLLAKGADINALNATSTSLLHLALQTESTKLALFLLKKGINPNIQQQSGHTPLSLIIDKCLHAKAKLKYDEASIKHDIGFKNLFLFLLQNGADPNCPQDSALNPFYQAWTKQEGGSVKVLLKYGAKPLDPFDMSTSQQSQRSLRSNTPFDPLQEAIKAFEPRVVRCLLKHGAQIKPLLFQTLLDQLTSDEDLFDLMIDSISFICFQNKNVQRKKLELKYSDSTAPSKKEIESQTKQVPPKNLTARDLRLIILQLLMIYGVDPNLPDETGQSPLAKAYLNGQTPQQDVIDLLQQAGAHLYRAGYKGKPLLDELTKRSLLNSVTDQGPVPTLQWLAHQKVLACFRGEKENIETLEQALKGLPTQFQEQYFPEFISKADQTEEDYVGEWLSYRAVQQLLQDKIQAEEQARRQAYFQRRRFHESYNFERNYDSDEDEDHYSRRAYFLSSSDSDEY